MFHDQIYRGRQGVGTTQENHRLLYDSLEILVQTSNEKLLDPSGPIASRGRFVWPSVKYVDN